MSKVGALICPSPSPPCFLCGSTQFGRFDFVGLVSIRKTRALAPRLPAMASLDILDPVAIIGFSLKFPQDVPDTDGFLEDVGRKAIGNDRGSQGSVQRERPL